MMNMGEAQDMDTSDPVDKFLKEVLSGKFPGMTKPGDTVQVPEDVRLKIEPMIEKASVVFSGVSQESTELDSVEIPFKISGGMVNNVSFRIQRINYQIKLGPEFGNNMVSPQDRNEIKKLIIEGLARGRDRNILFGDGCKEPLGICNIPGITKRTLKVSFDEADILYFGGDDGQADGNNICWIMSNETSNRAHNMKNLWSPGDKLLGKPVRVVGDKISNNRERYLIARGDLSKYIWMSQNKMELSIELTHGENNESDEWLKICLYESVCGKLMDTNTFVLADFDE